MACRASMAVPFLFSAVPTVEGDLLVDGGVLDNCPIHVFDAREGCPNPRTLGLWISTTGGLSRDGCRPAFGWHDRIAGVGLCSFARMNRVLRTSQVNFNCIKCHLRLIDGPGGGGQGTRN